MTLLQTGWRPGLGDPTLMGWLTVLLYLLTAGACWWRSHKLAYGAYPRFRSRFWRTLSILLLLLGINKQLNFLSLFTNLGRSWAWQQQWWRERQSLQLIIVEIILLLTLTLLLAGIWQLHHLPNRYLLAFLGLALLFGFVLIRAISLHAVDYYLYTPFAGLQLNWVIEVGLLLLLTATAIFPVRTGLLSDSTPLQSS